MALFKNMSITYQGMALFAKAQAGQEIHFTKMQVGGGQIGTQNPATLISLIDSKLDIPITSITPNPELKSATIIGNITNKDVKEALYICEMGLFAKDPDAGEILYGYASCGQYGDYYAPEAQGPYNWQYQISAAIGNAANVTAELSQLNWDYALMNSTTDFIHLKGGNQKEINKSIDNKFKEVVSSLDDKALKSDLGNVNDTSLDSSLKGKSLTQMAKVLFQNADNAQKGISTVIGSPLSASDTLTSQINKIQGLKNTFASNLTNQGQASNGNESLQNLINKIPSIFTGKKFAKGLFNKPYQINGLDFKPNLIAFYAKNFKPGYISDYALYISSELAYLVNRDSINVYFDSSPFFGKITVLDDGFKVVDARTDSECGWVAIG